MALLEGDTFWIQSFFIYIYIYSGFATIIRFKYIKTQYIFTSFDKVAIMLHNFDSNSEHTIFTLQVIFGRLLKILSCDKRLILKEHLTVCLSIYLRLYVCLPVYRSIHPSVRPSIHPSAYYSIIALANRGRKMDIKIWSLLWFRFYIPCASIKRLI